MSFENLQTKCSDIVAKYDNKKSNKDTCNIYKILHITHNEVLMCRVLADFLNPQGMHRQGCRYLQVFLKEVLDWDIAEEILQEARVYREYPITNDRRIDIVIRFRSRFIPIEVKINAGEQKSQCYDYFQFAKERDTQAFVVYLTKYGDSPSNYSTCGGENDSDCVPKDKIRCVSFAEDIVDWLEKIKVDTVANMQPLIAQYIDAIKDFTENEEEEYQMELAKQIGENSQTLRTSIEIAEAVDDAKVMQMQFLFQEFEKQMLPILEKYGLEEEQRSRWFHYKEQATRDFYARNESTYPGVNYVVKGASLSGGLSLWLRIEVEYRLFAGFCLFNYDMESEFGQGDQQDDISDEMWMELQNYVVLPEKCNCNSWIIDWAYLPTGSASIMDNIETVPNFKTMNKAAIELADKDKRAEFVRKSILVIEDVFLSRLK